MATFVLLVVAGLGAGLTGSIAGLASLISYPVLLPAGLPPITANVTNTVALVFSGVGSVSASRPELHNQGRRLRRLVPAAVAGGTLGAYLLIRTPSNAFEKIVPVLIAVASVAVMIRRKPAELAARHDGPAAPGRDSWWLVAATFGIGRRRVLVVVGLRARREGGRRLQLVHRLWSRVRRLLPALTTDGRHRHEPARCRSGSRRHRQGQLTARVAASSSSPSGVGACIYGGYFGAAAGVLLLALILLATGELLPRSNAIKNVLLGSANLVAAAGFALFAHIAWMSALPLAIGLLVGARLGPRIVRRAPATGLRLAIGACGLGLAIYLGVGAYR